MNCPNCKNPIQDNSIECEWCGNKLANKNDYLNTPSSAKSNKTLKTESYWKDIMIKFSYVIMLIGFLVTFVTFYKIEILKYEGEPIGLYLFALLIPLGWLIIIINKHEK